MPAEEAEEAEEKEFVPLKVGSFIFRKSLTTQILGIHRDHILPNSS